jgi:hypothetical protein
MNIKDFISDYSSETVNVSPGVSYDQRDIINESYRLYNGKFEQEVDETGFRRIFYRMIWVIFRTIIMSSDIDLKDMNMKSLNGNGIKTLALFKLAIRSHLLRTFFGKYVDKVMSEMVWFGTSITKRVDGRVETVDLRNYIFTPHIKDPQQREHAEYCYYSYDEMLSHKDEWKEHWSEIEELWKQMQKRGETQFKVVEFWTWDKMKDKKIHKVCIKYLDREDYKPEEGKTPNDWNPYLEIDKFITPYKKERDSERMQGKLGAEEEMFPYEQADLFDCPGRALGMGCAELLAGLNEHYNEYFNLKRKKDILDLRGIFVHNYTSNSNSLTQEFLNNLETGDVLQLSQDETLQRLVIDTKTAEFIANVDKLYEVMRLVMGVTAQGTGEEMPGSTSATGIKANFATQQTTYDYVRERMHHFLQRLFMNGYFEDILDEIDAQEMTAIIGDPKDLAEIDKTLIDKTVEKASADRYNYIEKTKGDVDWNDVQILQDLEEAETKQLVEAFKVMGGTRWASIKKSLLKGFKYSVEFFVNSETFDKQAKLEFLNTRLADPNFTGSRKAVEDAIFDLMNENPRQFDKTAEEKAEEVEKMRQEMMMENQMPSPISL